VWPQSGEIPVATLLGTDRHRVDRAAIAVAVSGGSLGAPDLAWRTAGKGIAEGAASCRSFERVRGKSHGILRDPYPSPRQQSERTGVDVIGDKDEILGTAGALDFPVQFVPLVAGGFAFVSQLLQRVDRSIVPSCSRRASVHPSGEQTSSPCALPIEYNFGRSWQRGGIMVRVRFAPSPTGYFHVGSARTALFNWLFARHHGGTFILRIEDTDRERSTDESIDQVRESLEWIGLDWDEYYRQTDRHAEHLRAAQRLRQQNLVYEREGAWWFRVPTEGETVVHDDLLGGIVYRNDQLKDFVIRRSDGSFIYHFVVVVDDADMGVTHVIRGDEHLNNAPKHILLFEALGRPVPRFIHLPLLLGTDREKLSKRHGAASLLEYRDQGFLPETMLNFLARLGWSHGNQEIFSIDELVERFSVEGLNKSAAVFESTKLRWLNQQHLKRVDLDRLLRLVAPFVLGRAAVSQDLWNAMDPERLRTGANLLRDRCHTLADLSRAMEMLFPVPLDAEDAADVSREQAHLMDVLADALEVLVPFTPESIERTVRETLAGQGAKLKDVALACRIAATGRKAGPGLFEILAPIGGKTVAIRLRASASGGSC
jgi:glutamyl-tRNA synthetase